MSGTSAAPLPLILTAAGRDFLQARLERVATRLADVAEELATERSAELVEEQQQLLSQQDELAQVLRSAVSPGEIGDDPSIVELGDEVELEFPDGTRESFLIVHPLEAGLDEHRTSADAPLATAVLGHRPGDRVTVTSPSGVYSCTIVHRERSS